MPTKVENITNVLREQIVAGDFGRYGRLPSRTELAKQFNTTRETINKVVLQLQAEGLLVAKGTRGVSINKPRMRIPGITPRFDLLLQEQGLTPVETNISIPEVVPAPLEVANAFSIEKDAPVVRRFRRQGTTIAHYRLAENFYSIELAGGAILKKMQEDDRFDVLQAIKEAHGKVITQVHEDVIGRLPTKEEQELLGIIRQAPVLEVLRTNYAEDNTVVMFNKLIFVASFFVLSYNYSVEHWKGKP